MISCISLPDPRRRSGRRSPARARSDRDSLALAALLLTACCLWCAQGVADEPSAAGYRSGHAADHDRARHALDRGEVLPIAEILSRVGEQVPGDLLELEFEREEGHGHPVWVYELKILTPDGLVREIEVDAASGQLLKLEHD